MTEPATYDMSGKRVYVAGHRGMVGAALVRRLAAEDVEVITATRDEVDLTRQEPAEAFLRDRRPDVVLLAAAKVGGIEANRTRQGEFLYDNLMIAANVVHAAHLNEVERTVILGSSCIYPRDADQPIAESSLLTGPLEPTNEGYAIAKIAALELGAMYHRQYDMDVVSLMPSNLYGPHDNYDPTSSHVLAALVRRIHEAHQNRDAEVVVWGTGTPRREFLHVDDLADATLHALRHHRGEEHLNIGWGRDITIRELAERICEVVGFEGELAFDTSMPDGMQRKLLDTERMRALGWQPSIELRAGLIDTYRWFRGHVAGTRP